MQDADGPRVVRQNFRQSLVTVRRFVGARATQFDAAITGGRLYLAAYALRLGATGLTFYDDDVTAFFSPHAAGKSVMFLVALGKPVKRKP